MGFLKTALITGASRGIGAECAKVFAKDNYNVVINYNNSENQARALEESLIRQGFSAKAIKADVSKEDEVGYLVSETVKAFGSIDVLVNNAGIWHFGVLTDISSDCWDHIINVNLKSVFLVTKAVLPYMINKKEGSIINVSSIWGLVGASCEVPYSAAKAGVIGFTKALSKEVGPSNIRVNCVAPGVIGTDMNKDLSDEELADLKDKTPLGRIGSPEEIAKIIRFLASDGASFITGQVISPNGGFVIY
ncbi:MAG: 3-oxoacyl-ACP reductase FabG [Clostridiaceae bacterium]|nr:3-oxoacyl-ACP reductase FabG [Clostridiaceae bacterium]